MKRLFKRHRDRDRGPDTPPPEGLTAPTPPLPSTPFPSGIKLLHNPEGDAYVDIVFVHGLTGHRERTWTAGNATEPWPKTLLPTKIPNARVLTFGYDASVVDWRSVVSESRIGNHAMNLLNALANFRDEDDTNERPIIFVCHSMGGLVCEDALVSSHQRPERHLKNILSSTKGIVFLGTPHHGSGLAVWAERLSVSIGLLKQTNPNIVQVLRKDSEVLARIQDSFHTMIQSRTRDGLSAIQITCFYEELPLPVVGLVVPQDSAILPGYIPIGIRNNHQDMTKFVSIEDPGFIAVCGELRRWAKEARTSQVPRNPVMETKTEPEVLDQKAQSKPEEREGHFLVPHSQNHDFVGRSDILDRLKREFGHRSQSSTGKGRPRVCLHGLGGVGKTQIALNYAYWLHETRPGMSIFWVYASNADRFRQAFISVAEECDIPGHKNQSVDILSLVKTWLQKKENGPWLLVIDNADDPHLFFSQSQEGDSTTSNLETNSTYGILGRFIPECSHGSVLITTRNKQAGVKLAPGRPPIEVEKMSDSESTQMICVMTGDEKLSIEKATLLSNRLENLPLAIAQASAFMQENSMTIDRYLEILDDSDDAVIHLLSQNFETVGRDTDIPHAVMLTWVVSFEQIKRQHPLASEILSVIAFFDRQAIPRYLFWKCFSGENDAEFEYYYKNRKAFGVGQECENHASEDETDVEDYHEHEDIYAAEEDEEGTDEVGRKGLKGLKSYEIGYTCQNDDSHNDDNWKAASDGTGCSSCISSTSSPSGNDHNEATQQSLPTRFTEEVDSVVEQPAPSIAELIELENTIGTLKAFSIISEGIDQNISMHRLVQLATKTWLAKVGSEKRFAEKALQTIVCIFPPGIFENMKVCKALLPHAHAVLKNATANNYLNNLLKVLLLTRMNHFYINSGQTKICIETCQRTIILANQRLGKTHPLLLTAMRRQAASLVDLNRLKEGAQMLSTLMDLQKQVYPDNDPKVLRSRLTLCQIYRYQDRFEESKEILNAILDQCEEKPGKPTTLKLNILLQKARTLMDSPQLQEAEEILSSVSELAQKYYGASHLVTLQSIDLYVQHLESQGLFEKAEGLCLQALQGQDVLSNDYPREVLQIMDALGRVLYAQNRFEEAEDIQVRVVDAFLNLYGEDYLNFSTYMFNLALTKQARGRLEEAEETLTQAYDTYAVQYGPGHPETLGCMYWLARLLRDRRKSVEAKELMKDAVQRHQCTFGLDHPKTRECQENLREWQGEDLDGSKS